RQRRGVAAAGAGRRHDRPRAPRGATRRRTGGRHAARVPRARVPRPQPRARRLARRGAVAALRRERGDLVQRPRGLRRRAAAEAGPGAHRRPRRARLHRRMTIRRRGSLVRRLSIGASLWVAALVLVVGSAAVFQYWRTSVRAIDARLADEARALAARISVVDDLLEIDIDVPAATPPAAGPGAPVTGAVRYYGIYDATGRLIDGRTPAPARLLPGKPFRTRDGFREAHVPGPRDSVIVVGESLEPA